MLGAQNNAVCMQLDISLFKIKESFFVYNKRVPRVVQKIFWEIIFYLLTCAFTLKYTLISKKTTGYAISCN